MERLFKPTEQVLEPIELDDAELAAVAGGFGNVTLGGSQTATVTASNSATVSNSAHNTQ
jgi:hypothetical protein